MLEITAVMRLSRSLQLLVYVCRRLVELTLITKSKHQSDEPLELLEDGSYVPIATAAEEESVDTVTD